MFDRAVQVVQNPQQHKHAGDKDHQIQHQSAEIDSEHYSGALVVSASACNSPLEPSILPLRAA